MIFWYSMICIHCWFRGTKKFECYYRKCTCSYIYVLLINLRFTFISSAQSSKNHVIRCIREMTLLFKNSFVHFTAIWNYLYSYILNEPTSTYWYTSSLFNLLVRLIIFVKKIGATIDRKWFVLIRTCFPIRYLR